MLTFPLRRGLAATLVGTALLLLVLHACQEPGDGTGAVVQFNITVKGTGGGSGTVKSQSGLTPAIDCVITTGTPSASGCTATYTANTFIILTATPNGGTFEGWSAPCDTSGTGPCQLTAIQTRTITVDFSAGSNPPPAGVGRWEPVFPTPVVAVHLTLLPTGKVLLWGVKGESQLWDPQTGDFTEIVNPYEVFCAGQAFLPDGRLLVAGGHITSKHGLPLAAIFDPSSNSWSTTATMAYGRWYPTNTTLPNGDILTIAGRDEEAIMVLTPEVWHGGSWRKLTSASGLDLPYYPRMFVAPNGRLFMAGERPTTYYLTYTGAGAWTEVGDRKVRDRDYGSAVEYAPGKIVYIGGGDPPTSSAEMIDLNQTNPAWRLAAPMAYARRHMNATLLADGTVLVTNGTSGPGFSNVAAAVRVAELWNPATDTWSTMATEAEGRVYHSTALLLPDGRVLSSGSGDRDAQTTDHRTAQIFTPPYLFRADGGLADRPTITSAPSALTYGQTFTVATPNPAAIARGTLIRLSSVTHAFNASQLIIPLTFTRQGATLSATALATSIKAPPGPYLLFLIGTDGVPSVGRILTIGP